MTMGDVDQGNILAEWLSFLTHPVFDLYFVVFAAAAGLVLAGAIIFLRLKTRGQMAGALEIVSVPGASGQSPRAAFAEKFQDIDSVLEDHSPVGSPWRAVSLHRRAEFAG